MKLREHTQAAAAAGALAEAMEYARLTGRLPDGWTRAPNAIIVCDDQWLVGCAWSGTEREASVIDDALCCPLCGSIL